MKKQLLSCVLFISVLCFGSNLAWAETTYNLDGYSHKINLICEVFDDEGNANIYTLNAGYMKLNNKSGEQLFGWSLNPEKALSGKDWNNKKHSFEQLSGGNTGGISDNKLDLAKALINIFYPKIEGDYRFSLVLQTAIWTVMMGEDDFDPSSSDFQYTGWLYMGGEDEPPVSLSWLDAQLSDGYAKAMGGDYVETISEFHILEGSDDEGLVLAFGSSDTQVTPIPGVALLVGTGFAGLIFMRRKKIS